MAGYSIDTKSYGKVTFAHIYTSMSNKEHKTKGGSIGLLDNGVWCHCPSGHPISLEEGKRILSESNPSMVSVFEDWYLRNEDDAVSEILEAARPILINSDDIPVFADGEEEEVTRVSAILAYYKPDTAILEVALRLFEQRRIQRENETVKAVLTKDQEGQTNLDQAFGRDRAGRPQPSSDPMSPEEIKAKRQERAAYARAERRRKADAAAKFAKKE